ncbi:MAG: hypothetical protein F6J98_25305 [Moorea sp. SIO4G2]|nr:hypothetical protein [Moorena sp. SIO4G2]
MTILISSQLSAYVLRTRYANSYQLMCYAHATRTVISLCATHTLREQLSLNKTGKH